MKSIKKAEMDVAVQPGKGKSGQAQCPRCKSVRLQRGYKHTPLLLRLVRRSELLCNNCSLEFREFGLWAELSRKPSTKKESHAKLRRAPRYQVHLPVTISLADKEPASEKLIFSKASRGHCVVISKVGMALSFVGSKFTKRDFSQTGRLLFVVIMLPKGPVDALITTVTHKHTSADGRPNWFVAATITQMNEGDTASLAAYLDERAARVPVLMPK